MKKALIVLGVAAVLVVAYKWYFSDIDEEDINDIDEEDFVY